MNETDFYESTVPPPLPTDEARIKTISTIALVICATGLLGNFLSLVVLTSKRMQNLPYVYPLLGLAISDVFLLILHGILTLDHLGIWVFSDSVPLHVNIVFLWDWIATLGSKSFTVAIAVERFIVVYFPLKARGWITVTRAKMVTIGIFAFVISLSVFSFIYERWIDPQSFDAYAAVIVHFLPFLLVFAFNLLIVAKLRNQRSVRQELDARNSVTSEASIEKEEKSVTRMLMCIIVVFGICYSFELIRRFMNYFWKEYMSQGSWYSYNINVLADLFYLLNSSVNFFIYCLLGSHFRKTFYQSFGSCFCSIKKYSQFYSGSKISDESNGKIYTVTVSGKE